ncbi:MAG TPA: hypothetical protein VK675_00730 [Candidatus Paceibacterota bacterium]|nr:hypothetical protein [Candidatus Paceibacterota bacterium]
MTAHVAILSLASIGINAVIKFIFNIACHLNAKCINTMVEALRITNIIINVVFDPAALGFINIKTV